MNLIAPAFTGIGPAFAEVCRLAAEAEVEVAGAELVGLAPLEALGGESPRGFGFELKSDRILEHHIVRRARYDPFALPLLEALGQKGAPGGGSAAAFAGALGAATAIKVAILSRRNGTGAVCASLQKHSLAFRKAAEDDALALENLLSGYKKDSDIDIAGAARKAAGVPLAMLERCVAILDDFQELATRAVSTAVCDLTAATHLIVAAAGGAVAMVDANLPLLEEPQAADLAARSGQMFDRIRDAADKIRR